MIQKLVSIISQFRNCKSCWDDEPRFDCETCKGTGQTTIRGAVKQFLDLRYRWWSLKYDTKLWYLRLFTRCPEPGCKNRPLFLYEPGTTYEKFNVACNEHVVRGCCWPYGTTLCAEWCYLPWSDRWVNTGIPHPDPDAFESGITLLD